MRYVGRMNLFRHPLSSCSRRAVQAVLELGLEAEVELVTVDLAKGAQRAPEFLAKNPNGRVPVLVDGDFVLWESNVIVRYPVSSSAGAARTCAPSARLRRDGNTPRAWRPNRIAAARRRPA